MFTYNRKTLDAESSARGSFVEKKILYFRKVCRETTHIGGLFFKRRAAPGTFAKYKMEHFATRLESLWTLPTVAKSTILNMAGVLKPRLVTKPNGNRDH